MDATPQEADRLEIQKEWERGIIATAADKDAPLLPCTGACALPVLKLRPFVASDGGRVGSCSKGLACCGWALRRV